jgi:hypothetical protein
MFDMKAYPLEIKIHIFAVGDIDDFDIQRTKA